jgi:riboflavin kinase/FMN adenylyltransferase
MGVEEELAESSPQKDTLLTIGVFDGVHLGHRYLIARLKEDAGRQNLLGGVVTFRQRPREILLPQAGMSYLTDLGQRVDLLKNEGVELISVLTFTPELARLGARQFVGLLKKYLRMCGLVTGPDFALGRGRERNVDTLRALGREMDFSVTVVSPLMINDEIVSSTAIRKALAEGNVKKVRDLVGRPFNLRGNVIAGAGRGTKLGFPTANLDIILAQALPADGVYATRACIGGRTYQSVTNIGKRPTFGGGERMVEVYILDYHGDLYGRELEVDVIERLRGEKKFDTAEELRKQVVEDINQGRAILNAEGGN